MLVSLLLALVSLPAAHAGGDSATLPASQVVRALDEQRFTADIKLADSLRLALDSEELTVDGLCAHLGQRFLRDDQALGFGLWRLSAAGQGGYTTALIRMLTEPPGEKGVRRIAEMRVELTCHDIDEREPFSRLAPRLPANAREINRTLRVEWRNDELSQSLRRAVGDELGVVAIPEVPAELRDAFELLTSPFDALALGRGCGFTGLAVTGAKETSLLADAGRFDLLRVVLRGVNPEGRGWAAHALQQNLRKGATLDPRDAATIDELMRLPLELQTCGGCVYSRARFGPALEQLGK